MCQDPADAGRRQWPSRLRAGGRLRERAEASAGGQAAARTKLPPVPEAVIVLRHSCALAPAGPTTLELRSSFLWPVSPPTRRTAHPAHEESIWSRTCGSCERLRTVGSQMRTSLDGAREAHSDGYMVVSAGARVFEPKCKFALPGTMCAMPTESSVIGTMGSWRCRSVCSG